MHKKESRAMIVQVSSLLKKRNEKGYPSADQPVVMRLHTKERILVIS
jgi:hypothetical protein